MKGDAYLEERLIQYDVWPQEGSISFSSKVIPVREALDVKQWVLPTEQVIELLRGARSYALARCTCRSHYQRCDNPLDVCFLLDDAADQAIADHTARHVSLEEAMRVLRQANECGLMHLTICEPEQTAYAVCSCRPFCCHDLRFLQINGRSDLIARSEYVAPTDMQACTQCSACVQRCVFGARLWKDSRLGYDAGACYGCGLCVAVCPAGATFLKPESASIHVTGARVGDSE